MAWPKRRNRIRLSYSKTRDLPDLRLAIGALHGGSRALRLPIPRRTGYIAPIFIDVSALSVTSAMESQKHKAIAGIVIPHPRPQGINSMLFRFYCKRN